MGYYLKAFIGKVENLKPILNDYKRSECVSLLQGFSLIPFTGELYDEINQFK